MLGDLPAEGGDPRVEGGDRLVGARELVAPDAGRAQQQLAPRLVVAAGLPLYLWLRSTGNLSAEELAELEALIKAKKKGAKKA